MHEPAFWRESLTCISFGGCRYGALADIDAAIQAKVKSLPPDSMLSAEVCLCARNPLLCLKGAVNLLCLTAVMP